MTAPFLDRRATAAVRRELAGQTGIAAPRRRLPGHILQLPLPRHLDANAGRTRTDPARHADGLHPVDRGRQRGIAVERPIGPLLARRSENATVAPCRTGTKSPVRSVCEADAGNPLPGGVGPMTRAMPLANVVEAAERNANPA